MKKIILLLNVLIKERLSHLQELVTNLIVQIGVITNMFKQQLEIDIGGKSKQTNISYAD